MEKLFWQKENFCVLNKNGYAEITKNDLSLSAMMAVE